MYNLELLPTEVALLTLLENLDYSKFKNDNFGRPAAIDSYTMMVIITYARMDNRFSSRAIEKLCKRDKFISAVLSNRKFPSHMTINRFIKNNPEAIEDFSVQIVKQLDLLGELSKDILFQDGTKIESRAGKYSFAWKSATVKNLEKLKIKIQNLFVNTDIACDEKDDFVNKLNILIAKLKSMNIELTPEKTGRGHSLTVEQKLYKQATEYLNKYNEYIVTIDKIGPNRNSMSKTDNDATFMRMKEDYMRNDQLKPAYNIQTLVDSNYIVGTYISSDRTDYYTMKPALEKVEKHYDWKYEGYCADSGYDSQINHAELENKEMTNYIKPQNWEISKKRKFIKDISRKENMEYDKKGDYYICANNKKLKLQKTYYKRNADKSRSEIKIYKCVKGCISCPLRSLCIKTKAKYKRFDVNREYDQYRKICYENLTSEFGAEVRVNRSIQAEGVFARIKGNHNFRRFLSFGKTRTQTEWILMTMAMNISCFSARVERGLTSIPFWYKIESEKIVNSA